MLPDENGVLPSPANRGFIYSLGGYDVTVRFTPVSGLIDINAAPEGLLFLLFSSIDDLDENAAHELALNVVEWRSANPLGEGGESMEVQSGQRAVSVSGGGGGSWTSIYQPGGANLSHGRFKTVEDLLQVPGIERQVFEAVQDAVYVSPAGQSGVDWASAPVPVLRALGGLDEAAAREIAQSRVNDKDNMDGQVAPEGIDLSFQQASPLSSYRIDARVELDGSVFNRRRWVDRARTGADGLPWLFVRSEAVRVIPETGGVGVIAGEGADAGS